MLRRLLACAIVALTLSAPFAWAQPATNGPYWPGPAVSGSWYDPARSGEGLIVQYLQNGKALVIWFTYPPAGGASEQAWLITDLGRVEGSKLKFDKVYQPQGGIFGDAFNPANISNVVWGTMELEFTNCNAATLRYSGPPAFGSGERALTRLTALDQLQCNGTRAFVAGGARDLAGLRAKSGAWYVPSRSGEGWMVEELPDGRTLVYWFTYDPQGRQAWTIGVGTRVGNRLEIVDNALTRGTHFGSAFDPAQVQQVPWGRLTFTFDTCDSATVSYNSGVAGYGSGTRTAARLSSLGGAACIDGTPLARTRGNWVESAAIPGPPQSEHAATVLDGKIYMMSGFGDPRGFKRYDAATDTWATLQTTPAGRDHLAAFAIDGGVFMSGGSPQGGGDDVTIAFRYDVAAARWEPRPEVGPHFGSHAAMLNGRAYIGSFSGSLQEYDPAQRLVRTIARASTRQRDHSQVVAFLGEIWMIAGRTPETTSVSIYDPVTEKWRDGPSLNRVRGGFAAAVVGDQIVIGGGEVLGASARIEPSVEVYTAGMSSWQLGPDLPLPVHGVAGAAVGGRFYAIGGSRNAATAEGNTGRMHSILLEQ
jgi:N-acetylneuraminic acid mutarotase